MLVFVVLTLTLVLSFCWCWTNTYIRVELCEWSPLHLEVYISVVRGLFVTLVLLVSLFIAIYIRYYINLEFSSRAYSLLMLTFMGRIVVLLVSANWLVLIFG